MTVEEQLRDYKATLDVTTEQAAATHGDRRIAPVIRIRPARTILAATVAVAATVAIAFATVGVTHRTSTPPAGPTTLTTTGSTTVATIAPPFTGDTRTVVVPSVVGLNASAAANALGIDGFVVMEHVLDEQSLGCAQPAGDVTAQDPPPGTRAPMGSVVTVTVCAG